MPPSCTEEKEIVPGEESRARLYRERSVRAVTAGGGLSEAGAAGGSLPEAVIAGGGLSEAGATEKKLVKELVITEDFEQNGIKNWPIRTARHLLHDTEKWAAKDEEFCKKSVGVAEELYIR